MKLSVGVFFGGCSTEHEVSVISAVQAMHALDPEKYQVTPFYTTKQGVLYTGEALLQIENYRNIPALLEQCTQAAILRRSESEVWAVRAQPKKFGRLGLSSALRSQAPSRRRQRCRAGRRLLPPRTLGVQPCAAPACVPCRRVLLRHLRLRHRLRRNLPACAARFTIKCLRRLTQ